MIRFKVSNDHLKRLETLVDYEELYQELLETNKLKMHEMCSFSFRIEGLKNIVNSSYKRIQKQFYIKEEKNVKK